MIPNPLQSLCAWALVLALAGTDALALATLPQPSAALEDVATRIAAALAREQRGELKDARELWLALAPEVAPGTERDAIIARARSLAARLALRDEIQTAVPTDQRVFAEIGIDKADATGIVSGAKHTPWHEVSLDILMRAAAAARASRDAQNGLVFETLVRGTEARKRDALLDLGRRFERGEIDAGDAFAAVARARSEPIPARGYAFQNGVWIGLDVAAEKARSAGLEEAARALETAASGKRESALQALEKLGPEGAARVLPALEKRLNDAALVLAQAVSQRPVIAVVEARKTLDECRKSALDLIFDEERYFYPYTPPECPEEKVKLYAGVQQEVDGLVSKVRDAWKFSRRANLSPNVKIALDELDWNRAVRTPRKLAFAWPEALPTWVDGLDRNGDFLDLKNFAWDAKERSILRRNGEIDALNTRAWQRKESDAARRADGEEQKQVEVTNEYRRMFGRNVLAWNPKLQTAAQGHSDYMSLTGDFGHFEKDPARRTPGDRLRLAGYSGGGGENCSLGNTSAEGAHTGWTHSSGHHRNILGHGHREMASALAAIYWTQNFGSGREFEAELARTGE